MANGNGVNWTKGLIAGVGLVIGLVIGAATAGVAFGGFRAHVDDKAIHETQEQKEARIRRVIDREVAPHLDRLEEKIDELLSRRGG